MTAIRPLKTDADYQAALRETEQLFEASPNTSESDRPEVLTTLVEAYEAHHYPIPAPDPIEEIEYYMESRGLSSDDLEPYIGSSRKVREVLSRQRSLSLTMIRKLHTGLGIAAEILIRPYELFRAAARNSQKISVISGQNQRNQRFGY